ncbi:VOC family protein [Microlunatus sp. GCM10028923]|uniref:VOC family protein n=1 Tax=Microlunatus sp. GCM10028923 TaxID=3273400 RepID=UPI00362057CA
MATMMSDWRVLDTGLTAWFDAPSPDAAAELVRRIGSLSRDSGPPAVALRFEGVRISGAEPGLAEAISAEARELGLTADPTGLSSLRVRVAAADPPAVQAFWRTAFGYGEESDGLVDPSHRDPMIIVDELTEPRPLRNRIHVDVVRPPDAVTAVRTELRREPFGAYGVTLADPERNELDLVPGDRLPEGPDTSDWWAVFGAVVHYPVAAPAEAADLAATVVGLARDAEIPLLVDLRGDGITIDSGKDQWEEAPERFAELAGRVQAAARAAGLTADPARPRFVQFGIDAVDIPSLQGFWTVTLGLRQDPRSFVTDLYDPYRLLPVIFFQSLDPDDEDRRRQPNRIRFELLVPHDRAAARIDAAVGAGGRLVGGDDDRHIVADPEGNELIIVPRH